MRKLVLSLVSLVFAGSAFAAQPLPLVYIVLTNATQQSLKGGVLLNYGSSVTEVNRSFGSPAPMYEKFINDGYFGDVFPDASAGTITIADAAQINFNGKYRAMFTFQNHEEQATQFTCDFTVKTGKITSTPGSCVVGAGDLPVAYTVFPLSKETQGGRQVLEYHVFVGSSLKS